MVSRTAHSTLRQYVVCLYVAMLDQDPYQAVCSRSILLPRHSMAGALQSDSVQPPRVSFEVDPWANAPDAQVGAVDREKCGAEAAFKKFPVALLCHMPALNSGAEDLFPVHFRNAGASRVVYLPVDVRKKVAFKFACTKYAADDNYNEWRSNVSDRTNNREQVPTHPFIPFIYQTF